MADTDIREVADRIPKYSEYEWRLKEAAQYNLGYCEGMERVLELIFGGGDDE